MAKVLIIEDEKAMSDLITIKFKVDGFEVDQAFSLSEAKAKLASQKYDAVLSDYLLPDGNSLDLFTEIKSQIGNLPIVLATNYIEDLSQDKAKALGINDVIVKYQVVPAQMVEKIKTLIGNAGVLNPTPVDGAPNPLPLSSGNLPSAQVPPTVTPGMVVVSPITPVVPMASAPVPDSAIPETLNPVVQAPVVATDPIISAPVPTPSTDVNVSGTVVPASPEPVTLPSVTPAVAVTPEPINPPHVNPWATPPAPEEPAKV